MHTVACLQHQCCTAILYMAACTSSVCVIHLQGKCLQPCNARPWKGKTFMAASILSVLCVCMWMGPAAPQCVGSAVKPPCPQGRLLVLQTPQIPLEQTKLTQGVACSCLPALELRCAPTLVSNQHISACSLPQKTPHYSQSLQ